MNRKVVAILLGFIILAIVFSVKACNNKVIETNNVKEVVNYASSDEVMVITDYAYDYSSEDFCGLIGKVVKITYRSVYGIQQITGKVRGLYNDYFSLEVNNSIGDLYDYKDIGDIQVIE